MKKKLLANPLNIIITFLFLSACHRNSLVDTNKDFSVKYGKDVKRVMEKLSPQGLIGKKSDYRRHSEIIKVSSLFDLENAKIKNFNNRKIYNTRRKIAGDQMPIENFITIDEDIFKPKYHDLKKKPYRLEEISFANISIPYNDIFGKLSSNRYKKYHLVDTKILQTQVDKILEKFDDGHRAILLRVMKDKEIVMERISKKIEDLQK
jgi:hypothetical protein